MSDLEAQLRRYGDAIEQRVEQARAPRARRLRPLAAVAAVAILAVSLGGGLWLTGRTTTDDDRPAEQPDPRFGFESGWHTLDPGPLVPREGAATAWTGTEFVVWGGNDLGVQGGEAHNDGAAYDPATRTWRMMAPAPLPGGRATMAWTDEELLVWVVEDDVGSGTGPQAVRWPGAAWNPETDTWRELASAPRGRIEFTDSPSADREVIWTGGLAIAPGLNAAYDPSADAWTELPERPSGTSVSDAVWDGERLVLLAGGNGPLVPVSLAFSPTSGRWTELVVPEWPNDGVSAAWGNALVISDEGVIAVSSKLHSHRLGFGAEEWEPMESLPFHTGNGHAMAAVVGDTVMAMHAQGSTGLLRPDGRWALAESAPGFGELVGGGDVAFLWRSTADTANFPDAPLSEFRLFAPPALDGNDLAVMDQVPLWRIGLVGLGDWRVTGYDRRPVDPTVSFPPEDEIVFGFQTDDDWCEVSVVRGGGADGLPVEPRHLVQGEPDYGLVEIDGLDHETVHYLAQTVDPPQETTVIAGWPVEEGTGGSLVVIQCRTRASVDDLIDRLVDPHR